MSVSKGPARADDKSVFSISEKPISSLQKSVSFMPSGSLVAGFSKRTLPNGETLREIVFWERNGLRHGEFTLSSTDDIVNLDFSLDSTLLALHCVSQDKMKHSV